MYGPFSPPNGVEDQLVINLINGATSNFNVNQMYVGDITTTFVDNFPYGNTISSYGN
jgi:hypothetical protein